MQQTLVSLKPAVIIVLIILQACQPSGNDGPRSADVAIDKRPAVYTVNYPLAYMAARIGAEHVNVVFPAPLDVDPADWAPDADTISDFQQADLILLNGATYAAWVQRSTLRADKLVDTSAKFSNQYLPVDDAITHSHGPQGEHAHSGKASTVWLDPELATKQAEVIRDGLTALRPDLKNEFETGFAALAVDLHDLDARLSAVFKELSKTPLLFSHPVYQYLIHHYGLQAVSVHWEPDQLPGDSDIATLATIRKNHPATIMIWEDEPLAATRGLLAGLGISSIVFDPGANRPAEGDFLTKMHENVGNLQDAL